MIDLFELTETVIKFVDHLDSKFIKLEAFPDTPVAFRGNADTVELFWLRDNSIVRHTSGDENMDMLIAAEIINMVRDGCGELTGQKLQKKLK